jgi:hypothetical protein
MDSGRQNGPQDSNSSLLLNKSRYKSSVSVEKTTCQDFRKTINYQVPVLPHPDPLKPALLDADQESHMRSLINCLPRRNKQNSCQLVRVSFDGSANNSKMKLKASLDTEAHSQSLSRVKYPQTDSQANPIISMGSSKRSIQGSLSRIRSICGSSKFVMAEDASFVAPSRDPDTSYRQIADESVVGKKSLKWEQDPIRFDTEAAEQKLNKASKSSDRTTMHKLEPITRYRATQNIFLRQALSPQKQQAIVTSLIKGEHEAPPETSHKSKETKVNHRPLISKATSPKVSQRQISHRPHPDQTTFPTQHSDIPPIQPTTLSTQGLSAYPYPKYALKLPRRLKISQRDYSDFYVDGSMHTVRILRGVVWAVRAVGRLRILVRGRVEEKEMELERERVRVRREREDRERRRVEEVMERERLEALAFKNGKGMNSEHGSGDLEHRTREEADLARKIEEEQRKIEKLKKIEEFNRKKMQQLGGINGYDKRLQEMSTNKTIKDIKNARKNYFSNLKDSAHMNRNINLKIQDPDRAELTEDFDQSALLLRSNATPTKNDENPSKTVNFASSWAFLKRKYDLKAIGFENRIAEAKETTMTEQPYSSIWMTMIKDLLFTHHLDTISSPGYYSFFGLDYLDDLDRCDNDHLEEPLKTYFRNFWQMYPKVVQDIAVDELLLGDIHQHESVCESLSKYTFDYIHRNAYQHAADLESERYFVDEVPDTEYLKKVYAHHFEQERKDKERAKAQAQKKLKLASESERNV